MRPSFIKHVSEIERTAEQAGSDKGSRETFTDAAPFSDVFGFTRFGVVHEVLAPGKRSNWPHAVRFIVVGDRSPESARDRLHYPRHAALNAARGPRHWHDDERPAQPDGGHDGLPDRLRDNPVD